MSTRLCKGTVSNHPSKGAKYIGCAQIMTHFRVFFIIVLYHNSHSVQRFEYCYYALFTSKGPLLNHHMTLHDLRRN